MNITANTVASKLFVAFVAAAMLFTLAAPSAKAATAEELQAQIAALMAQITALQGGSSATSAAACTFTGALTIGSTGAEVKCLQDYLTPTYFKNAGGSTGTFGPITAAAVAAWQTANGISPAAGYFGPVSQAKYKALVAATPADDSSDDDSSTDDSDDATSGELGGEASLFDVTIDSASDDTIEEGAEEAELGVATVEFQDGDAQITRLDVSVDTALTGVDAWDAFEEVSLVVDGDVVATMDASDKDNYLSETDGTLRFSGLDIVAMEDEEVEITIAGTVNGSLDSTEEGAYEVSVDAIRFVDADDVTDTVTSQGGTDLDTAVSFTIGAAGADDEIIVKTSSSDPDGTTFELKDDAKSSWENVFTFDLDTKDSVNDVELTTVVLDLITPVGTTTYSTLVDDVELVIDGVTIDTVSLANATTSTTTLTFDVDGDVTIAAGERVAAELNVKFKALPAFREGATIQGRVTSAQADLIAAEGADDLATSQLSGSATGDVHTLRTKGINADVNDVSSAVTAPDSGTNDYAVYTIKVDVTAFNQDVYLSNDFATATVYALTNGAGASVVAGTRTPTWSSSDTSNDDTAGYFKISEGETETLTLKVTYTPGVAGVSARLGLTALNFAETGTTPNQTWTASPANDYETDVETMVN